MDTVTPNNTRPFFPLVSSQLLEIRHAAIGRPVSTVRQVDRSFTDTKKQSARSINYRAVQATDLKLIYLRADSLSFTHCPINFYQRKLRHRISRKSCYLDSRSKLKQNFQKSISRLNANARRRKKLPLGDIFFFLNARVQGKGE